MSRLGHRHSLAAGAILTLLVERNGSWTAIAAVLIFVAGVVVGRTWLAWRRWSLLLGAHLRRRLELHE
jgi:hypothetical protein